MKITHDQTQKLLSGSYAFTQFGFSMLITRLKGVYSKDSSQMSLEKCADEINEFLQKYSAIMMPDYAIIARL